MLPILVQYGGITLHTYSLMLALGGIAMVYVAWNYAERFGIDPEAHFRGAIYLVLAAIMGPKLFLAIQEFHYFAHHWLRLVSVDFLESGGVFYGGVVCAMVVVVVYVHHHRLDGFAVGDALTPGIAIGQSIGRLGCFAAGCCWGKPTTGFFGYTFHSAYAHATTGVPIGIELYPTQLLMAAGQFAIFLLLWHVAKRRAFVGQVAALYMIVYGSFRFLIDFLRFYDPATMFFGGRLTEAQLISLFLITGGMGIWVLRSGQPRAAAPAAA